MKIMKKNENRRAIVPMITRSVRTVLSVSKTSVTAASSIVVVVAGAVRGGLVVVVVVVVNVVKLPKSSA